MIRVNVCLSLPSDHYIPDEEYFNDTIENALEYINEFNAITFGVKPTYLSTQYGYIQTPVTHEVEPVKSFREKPDILTAKRMIDSGEYLWNSGIFLFNISKLLDLVREINPSLINVLSRIASSLKE